MGRITSTKPGLTSADIRAAVAAALAAHSFDTPLTSDQAQAAAAAALSAHSFLTEAQAQSAAESALAASPPSPIASIHRGSISKAIAASSVSHTTVTISSVEMSKTFVNILKSSGDGYRSYLRTVRLESATQIRFDFNEASSEPHESVSYEVIEFA